MFSDCDAHEQFCRFDTHKSTLEAQRSQALQAVLVDNKSIWSVLSNDPDCGCRLVNIYAECKCLGCKSTEALAKLTSGPFVPECGSNRPLIVRKSCCIGTQRTYFGVDHIQSTPFTNKIIVQFLLESELKKVGSEAGLSLFNAFICHDEGVRVVEYYYELNEANVANLTTDFLTCLVKQVVGVCRLLTKCNYDQGSKARVGLSSTPCSFVVNGALVTCPMTLKIKAYGTSSIVSNGKKVGPIWSDLGPLVDRNLPIKAEILSLLSGAGPSSTSHLKFTTEVYTTVLNARGQNIQWSPAVLNFYKYVIALASDHRVLEYFRSSGIWDLMWGDQDTTAVLAGESNVEDRLIGYVLNCQILDLIRL